MKTFRPGGRAPAGRVAGGEGRGARGTGARGLACGGDGPRPGSEAGSQSLGGAGAGRGSSSAVPDGVQAPELVAGASSKVAVLAETIGVLAAIPAVSEEPSATRTGCPRRRAWRTTSAAPHMVPNMTRAMIDHGEADPLGPGALIAAFWITVGVLGADVPAAREFAAG